MDWKKFELHTHTHHSDGDFTIEEIVNTAKLEEYEGIALTDHNTQSGHQEFITAIEENNLIGIKGIEWTTFFGHMLVLGCETYVDWRYVGKDEIDDVIRKIRNNNGVVGIAHPFAIGNPICTGYLWEFNIKDWSNIDYIEVWSRDNPNKKGQSLKAYEMWTKLLNKGIRISAVSGRDWHRKQLECNSAYTYLGFNKKFNKENPLESIKNGQIFVTMGPHLIFQLIQNNNIIHIGEEAKNGKVRGKISFKYSNDTQSKKGLNCKYINLVANGQIVRTINLDNNIDIYNEDLEVEKGWIRAEAYGDIEGNYELIAFTNPIYIV